MADPKSWYLRKGDGTEFGPVTLSELQRWASECRLVAGNQVSQDREEWQPVEDLSQLSMEWVARRGDGREYGPFNIKASGELYRHGVLPAEATLYNERTDETVELALVLRKLGEHQPAGAEPVADAPAGATDRDQPPVDSNDDAGSPGPTPAAPAKAPTSGDTDAAADTDDEPDETDADAADDGELAVAARAPTAGEPDALPAAGDAVAPAPAAAELAALRDAFDACRRQAESDRDTLSAARDKALSEAAALKDKLKGAAAREKQLRAESASLTAERDAAVARLSILEAEAADRQQTLSEQIESLRTDLTRLEHASEEATALQDAVDEMDARLREREQALRQAGKKSSDAVEQALKAARDRASSEQEAKIAIDGLAKQLSFMKKNNETLQDELDDARRHGARMKRALIVVVGAVLLAGSTMALVGRGCRRAPDAPPLPALPAVTPEEEPPARTPTPPVEERTAPPTRPVPPPDDAVRPATPAPGVAGAVAPVITTPGTPWPDIRVEGVAVRREAHTCSLVFDDAVFLRLTTLSTWGKEALADVARQLNKHWDRFSLVVEGHTDNEAVRPTSSHPDNYQLGLARANAVVEFLTRDCATPADALRATSVGENSPPFPNDTAANRKRNRTVVLKLKRKTP